MQRWTKAVLTRYPVESAQSIPEKEVKGGNEMMCNG